MPSIHHFKDICTSILDPFYFIHRSSVESFGACYEDRDELLPLILLHIFKHN